MTIFSVTKYVLPLLTSVFILVLVYCCFDEITDLEESANIPDGTFAKEKRKFVTILSEK